MKVVRSEKQTREDLQMWFDLKPLPWGKQMKELTPAGWTEPSPEYDDMDSQLGRRLFVLEHGFGTLVKCNRKKRSWGPCAVDFVDGNSIAVPFRYLVPKCFCCCCCCCCCCDAGVCIWLALCR